MRSRGVIEKCSFCQQRISEKRQLAKVEGRAVRDGEIETACQQACPAEAIVFGNQMETGSRVNQWKKNPRDYSVLGFLDNRPRLTYLAKVRNPNPKMPDYREVPLSIEEYKQMYHGDPFAEHGTAGGHGAADTHAAPAGHGASAKEGAH